MWKNYIVIKLWTSHKLAVNKSWKSCEQILKVVIKCWPKCEQVVDEVLTKMWTSCGPILSTSWTNKKKLWKNYVVKKLWTSHELAVNKSWKCCEQIVKVVKKLWTSVDQNSHEQIINKSWTSHKQVINKLWTSNEQDINKS